MKSITKTPKKDLSITQKRDLELIESFVGDTRPDLIEKVLKGEDLDIDDLLAFPCDEGDGY